VRTYDRQKKEIKTFTNLECEFSYRNSHFKTHPGRYVILDVQFNLRQGELSTAITYSELATKLGIAVGEKAPIEVVRATVLELRAAKGMLLNPNDPDSWSAGSFFTNPIVSKEVADRLPEGAPRWPMADGSVKTSAAWLIENSGIHKGDTHGGARISTKHVLALTNSGDATATEIAELAKLAHKSVFEKFGINLVAEVNLIGVEL
jgi:UDP-N-acetylmuramate dehydrogenase